MQQTMSLYYAKHLQNKPTYKVVKVHAIYRGSSLIILNRKSLF